MNSFHLVGCDYCSWHCSGPDSRSCSQLCQMVSLLPFRADEMRQERHLGHSQDRNESGRDLTYLYFPSSSEKCKQDWVICNKYWPTQIGSRLIGASLFCNVSELDLYALVYWCWISRLFQSSAVTARDQAVNLAPSQWDLTLVSHQGL